MSGSATARTCAAMAKAVRNARRRLPTPPRWCSAPGFRSATARPAIASFRASEGDPSAATRSNASSPNTPPAAHRSAANGSRRMCCGTPRRWTQAGVDRSVIALWLGHEQVETTQIYLDADLAMKERALARTAPLPAHAPRYRPPDELLAFLQSL